MTQPRRTVSFLPTVTRSEPSRYPVEGAVEPGPNIVLRAKTSPFSGKLNMALPEDAFRKAIDELLDLNTLASNVSDPPIGTIQLRFIHPTRAATESPALAKKEMSNVLTVKEMLLQLRQILHRTTLPGKGAQSIIDALGSSTWFLGVQALNEMKPHEWSVEFCAGPSPNASGLRASL